MLRWVCVLSCIALAVDAQEMVVSHQGHLLDSADQPLTKTLQMRFAIYADAQGGAPVWESNTCEVSVVRGYFSVPLGDTCDGTQSLDASHLPPAQTRYLETRISGVALVPRQRLTHSPSALLAYDAARLQGQSLADLDARYARLGVDGKLELTGDGSGLTNLSLSSLQSGSAQPGEVLGWSGTRWQPQPLSPASLTSGGANEGAVLRWTGASWQPQQLAASMLQSGGAQPGQVLKWNGTAWAPAADSDTQNAGSVTNVSGLGPLSVVNGSTTPVVSIAKASSTQDGFLSAEDWAAFDAKLDANDPRLDQARGSASGDLSGSYPNPRVAALQGRKVADQAPANGQVLKWVQALGAWAPQADEGALQATWPLSITNSGGGTPSIELPQASATTSGYLTAADYARFEAGLSGGGGGGSQLVTWTTYGNYVWPVPAGVTRVHVRTWGGGGGAGNTAGSGNCNSIAGGGGGGAYGEALIDVSGIETLRIHIGNGGASGTAGGATLVESGADMTLLSTPGGSGGNNGNSNGGVGGAGGLERLVVTHPTGVALLAAITGRDGKTRGEGGGGGLGGPYGRGGDPACPISGSQGSPGKPGNPGAVMIQY